MMKRIFTLISLLMFGFLGVGCMSTPKTSGQKEGYLYCNVFASNACFSIGRGDVMTMRVLVDFVLYNLELPGGLKVLVYDGYQPSNIPAENRSSIKRYPTPSGSYEYILTSDGRRVITYASKDGKSPLLQIAINKSETSQKNALIHFLETFRPCSGDGTGVLSCDKNQVLFKDFVQENLK